MAFYRGMSLRMCLLALAAASVIVVSMEAVQVHADSGCDSNGILLDLYACVGLHSIPPYTSNCCVALRKVYDDVKPSDTCICQTASPTLLASLSLTVSDVGQLITVCVGAYAVPSCL